MRTSLIWVKDEFTTGHVEGKAAAYTPSDRRVHASVVVFSNADRLAHLCFDAPFHQSKEQDNALCCPVS